VPYIDPSRLREEQQRKSREEATRKRLEELEKRLRE